MYWLEAAAATFIVALLYHVQETASCLQNLPWYQNQGTMGSPAPRLKDEVQALVPTYQFNCYGNVTMWGAYVEPPGDRDRYAITFQVWRPSADTEGCYSLIGTNSITKRPNNQQIILDVDQNQQLQIQPGDVVGFYADHLNTDQQDNMNGGIELDDGMSTVTVWYSRRNSPVEDTGSCGVRIQDGDLDRSTVAAPIVTAVVATATGEPAGELTSTAPSASSLPESGSSGGGSSEIIVAVGVTVGVVLILLVVTAIICVCIKIRRGTEGKRELVPDYAIAVNGDVMKTEAITMSHNEAYLIKPYITLIIGEEPPRTIQADTVDEGYVINQLYYEEQPVAGSTGANIETADHSYEPVPGDYEMARPLTDHDSDDGTGSSGYVINALSYDEPTSMHLPGNQPTSEHDYATVD